MPLSPRGHRAIAKSLSDPNVHRAFAELIHGAEDEAMQDALAAAIRPKVAKRVMEQYQALQADTEKADP
jgi:hypothetical protein